MQKTGREGGPPRQVRGVYVEVLRHITILSPLIGTCHVKPNSCLFGQREPEGFARGVPGHLAGRAEPDAEVVELGVGHLGEDPGQAELVDAVVLMVDPPPT